MTRLHGEWRQRPTWSLHLPAPNGLADISEAAAIACRHVSTDPPPAESASQATASAYAIDLSRLANGSKLDGNVDLQINTTTRTFTHTATHLAGVIAPALAETPSPSAYQWTRSVGSTATRARSAPDRAALARIGADHDHTTGGRRVRRLQPRIDYNYTWNPDEELGNSSPGRCRQLAKEPRVPIGTEFNVTVIPRSGFRLSDQSGWSDRTTALPSFNDGYRHGTAAYWSGAAAVFRSHRIGQRGTTNYVDTAFDKMRSAGEITSTEQTLAQKRHKRIRETLEGLWDIERTFLTGSYDRHTKIKPLEGRRHLRCGQIRRSTSGLPRDESPNNIVNLSSSSPANSSTSSPAAWPCRISMSDDDGQASFRAAPASLTPSGFDAPDPGRGRWIRTDPGVHAQLTAAKNGECNGRWVPFARCPKAGTAKPAGPYRSHS